MAGRLAKQDVATAIAHSKPVHQTRPRAVLMDKRGTWKDTSRENTNPRHTSRCMRSVQEPMQGLVAIARGKHPIPSRTRPLSPAAPMVLRLKTWESRSPPDHIKNAPQSATTQRKTGHIKPILSLNDTVRTNTDKHPVAGWSSPVARQAHNLKVVGSNPTPATNKSK